jgi:HK97 family phage portal protein
MGLIDRMIKRLAIKNNWTLTTGWPVWMGGRSRSGEDVSPRSAMQTAAVYCAVRILSETVAQLPIHYYRTIRTQDGRHKTVREYDSPLYSLLHDQPNPEMTSFIFREQMMKDLLLYGNHFSQIVRNNRGEIVALYPLTAQNVVVMRDQNAKLFYQYTRTGTGDDPGEPETIIFLESEVLHIPALGWNGLVGYSPIQMAMQAVGASLAADDYAATFYANAATPSGVLEFPGALKDPKKIREQWENGFSGAVNAGKTPVLEEGMTYKPISISPAEAQFLETRKFNVDEIARIFRIPPHMLADLERSSFSNIEHQSLEFVKYTIAPWIARIEQGLKKSLLLPAEKEDHFWAFNLEGLLRGDYQSRMNGYAIARQNGWMSANDIRELENMNMIPEEEGGDLYLVNGNMLPLAKAGAAYEDTQGGNEQ